MTVKHLRALPNLNFGPILLYISPEQSRFKAKPCKNKRNRQIHANKHLATGEGNFKIWNEMTIAASEKKLEFG